MFRCRESIEPALLTDFTSQRQLLGHGIDSFGYLYRVPFPPKPFFFSQVPRFSEGMQYTNFMGSSAYFMIQE